MQRDDGPNLPARPYSSQDLQGGRERSRRTSRQWLSRCGWWISLVVCLSVGIVGFYAAPTLRTLYSIIESELVQDDLEVHFYLAKTRELEYMRILGREETRRDDSARSASKRDAFDRFACARRDYELALERDERHLVEMIHPRERLIRDVALAFGDYPHAIPTRFLEAVEIQIKRWQSSNELRQAIIRLDESKVLPIIYRGFSDEGLSPHFIYLALIASGFRSDHVNGDPLRGYAKGLWQLTDDQATRAGLRLGPKSETERYDPDDERFDIKMATTATATILREIYVSDAQGSGLLALALHLAQNPHFVTRVNSYPTSPEVRNFWTLYRNQHIPQDQEDQLVSLFAAAVIGEHPRLFGFDFDNPLRGVGANPRTRPANAPSMLAQGPLNLGADPTGSSMAR